MAYTPKRSDTLGRLAHVTLPGGDLAKANGDVPIVTIRAAVDGYRCGQCGSEDIQKLSMVYESGTSTINTRTSGTSTGFGVARGGLGLGTAFNSSRTTGKQVSELAKRAAPPPRKFGAAWIGVGIGAGIIAWALGGIIAAIVLMGLSVWAAQPGIRYNRDVHPGLRAAWEQSWLCHRCGTVTRIA